MKQNFNIIRTETSMDMGTGHRTRLWESISGDDLVAGRVHKIHGNELTVTSIDEDEMEFSIPNERISKQGRYVFFFSIDRNAVCDWSDEYAGDLVDQMNNNIKNGALWKNIPLMREFIHEFKYVAPFRSEIINPAYEDVIYEVEKEVDEDLKDEPRGMGFCFGYWSAKRAALASRGIEWRSPSAMNPRVMFD